MKYLFAVASLMAVTMPVQAETIYLLIKSDATEWKRGNGVALHSIPMTSLEQCEEMGALIISSERFDAGSAKEDGFECIQGK